jgi:hypothetical protein
MSGPGSLRQALAMANDGDTINFDSSLNGETITPTSGQLNVDKMSPSAAPAWTIWPWTAAPVTCSNQPGQHRCISGGSITNGDNERGRGGMGTTAP